MTSRILLASVNRCDIPYPVYPLGLSHVAAALERAGHTVLILDMNRDRESFGEQVEDFGPDLVGLSLRNIDDVDIGTKRFFVPDLVEAARIVREATDAPVVIGGSAYSLFPRELLEMTGADYGVRGEGETAMARLAQALSAGTGVEHIPGLVHRRGGEIVCNDVEICAPGEIVPAARPENLVAYYRAASSMLSVQTQRGCPFRCCYCTYPVIEGTTVRLRAPEAVADEIAAIKASGVGYFFLVDSVFNMSREHVKAVCEELVRRDLGMKWCCFLRPSGLDDELMGLMARAGLTHIEFGTDSFCDSVLAAYGKAFTFEDVLKSSELARAHNVHYAHFLIAGGPGESEATLREGFENAKRLKRTVVFPFVGMRLYPGTALYEQAIAEGIITRDTSLLEPFFYVNPSLGESRARELLAECASKAANWIVGELPPELAAVAKRLRQKGVEGPLWEYLAR